jgi:hypothetical protein
VLECLQDMPTTNSLSLSHNKLGDEGIREICGLRLGEVIYGGNMFLGQWLEQINLSEFSYYRCYFVNLSDFILVIRFERSERHFTLIPHS